MNRKQAAILAHLIEENGVPREQLKARGQRLRLTDNQRRRLAAKGQPLGRRVFREIATIVSPNTILSWHSKLIAAKWRRTPSNRCLGVSKLLWIGSRSAIQS